MKRVIYLTYEECAELNMYIGNVLWSEKHGSQYTPTNDELHLLEKVREQTKW